MANAHVVTRHEDVYEWMGKEDWAQHATYTNRKGTLTTPPCSEEAAREWWDKMVDSPAINKAYDKHGEMLLAILVDVITVDRVHFINKNKNTNSQMCFC